MEKQQSSSLLLSKSFLSGNHSQSLAVFLTCCLIFYAAACWFTSFWPYLPAVAYKGLILSSVPYSLSSCCLLCQHNITFWLEQLSLSDYYDHGNTVQCWGKEKLYSSLLSYTTVYFHGINNCLISSFAWLAVFLLLIAPICYNISSTCL